MRRLCPFVIVFMQLACAVARAQDHGTLTVTATVVTSVAVVVDHNGNPKVVVANPVDPRDNVSYISFAPKGTENRQNSGAAKVQPTAKRKAATLR